jgi:ribosomal protein L35
MAIKTNKSFAKRLKVTKNGKIKSRRPGGNHFNAKESRSTQLNRKRDKDVVISKKLQDLFLVNLK